MSTRLIVGRPLAESELAEVLGMPRHRVQAVLREHGIRPAFHIGRRRTRCYAPAQIEALHAAVCGE